MCVSRTLSGGGELLSYFLDLNTSKKDEFKTPKGTIPYTDKDQQNIFAHVDYALTPAHEISLDFTKDKSDKSSGGDGAYYNQNEWSNIYRNDSDAQSTFLTYEGKIDERFSLHSNVGYTKRIYELTYGSPNTKPENFLKKQASNVYTERILQGEIRATANWLEGEKLRSIAGLQYKKVDMQSRPARFGVVGKSKYDKTERNLSPFAQIEAKPTPYTLFVAGVRHDSYDTASKKMKATSPNFGISLFPFANTDHNYTTLWAGYSEAFNTPTAPQRYLPKFLGGNPNLEPEKAKGYEVGIKQRIAHFANVELGYYHTDYTDQIRLIKLPSNDWLFYNEGKSKVKGFELSSEFYPTPWLIINVAYANSTTKNGEGKRLYGKVDESLKYGATITDLAGFDFSIGANQPLDLKLSDGKAHPSQKKTIIDAKLSYRHEVGRFVFTPFVAVENLTDKLYYSLTSGEPAINEGRNFRVGARARYNF